MSTQIPSNVRDIRIKRETVIAPVIQSGPAGRIFIQQPPSWRVYLNKNRNKFSAARISLIIDQKGWTLNTANRMTTKLNERRVVYTRGKSSSTASRIRLYSRHSRKNTPEFTFREFWTQISTNFRFTQIA